VKCCLLIHSDHPNIIVLELIVVYAIAGCLHQVVVQGGTLRELRPELCPVWSTVQTSWMSYTFTSHNSKVYAYIHTTKLV